MEVYNKYYREEREELAKSLKKNKSARIEKMNELSNNIKLDWEELMSLIRDVKNLGRQIIRERLLRNILQNIKE